MGLGAGAATLQTGWMETALPAYHAVVAMNSAAVFNGLFPASRSSFWQKSTFTISPNEKRPPDWRTLWSLPS